MDGKFYTFKPKHEMNGKLCCKLCRELIKDPKSCFCEKCCVEFKEGDLIRKGKRDNSGIWD